jgi:hypothetical protein
MRVPVLAPALARNQRGQLFRHSGGRWIEGQGVTPSQYDEDGGEGGEDENGDVGEEDGNGADSSVESE